MSLIILNKHALKICTKCGKNVRLLFLSFRVESMLIERCVNVLVQTNVSTLDVCRLDLRVKAVIYSLYSVTYFYVSFPGICLPLFFKSVCIQDNISLE